MLHTPCSKVYVKSNVCTSALSSFANLTKLKKRNFTYEVTLFYICEADLH